MRESNVLRATWLAVAALGCTLFRVNTGKGYVGKGVRQPDGNVLVIGGRPVALGFGMPNGDPLVGTSDLIGWTTVEITPEMVGHHVAVFTAIETKESGGGNKREEQINFVDRVRAAGGIAGFANSPAVAQGLVRDFCVKATLP
jgi:hypothetical protein